MKIGHGSNSGIQGGIHGLSVDGSLHAAEVLLGRLEDYKLDNLVDGRFAANLTRSNARGLFLHVTSRLPFFAG